VPSTDVPAELMAMTLGDSLNTGGLLTWVAELQAGNPDAADPEFRRILTRVERMTRAAFKRFARVGRFVEPDDVVQNTVVRLLSAFRAIRPASTRDFYALVNELIRREFLDLTRRYFGPQGHGTRTAAVPVGEGDNEFMPPGIGPDADADELAAFHEAVAKLPAREQEVIGLAYYHAWTQGQIAALFNVSTRTVQRWQEAAVTQIREQLASDR
jgi:RNA polymerase sigma-70 factor (ECF subfamily)